MVMSQVIYKQLKADNPEVVIDILAPAATLSVALRMPEIRNAVLLDQQHGELGLGYRFTLGRSMADLAYDQAILTTNTLKSALVPFFAGIPVRTGFLGEYRYFLVNDIRLLDKLALPRMVDRFVSLTKPARQKQPKYYMPELDVDLDNQGKVVEKLGLNPDRPVVGICPGAEFGEAKKWPERHYIALARRLIENGNQVWIFGGKADVICGAAIAEAVGPGCTNLAGETSLVDAIDLLALCQQVVTNDSGLMHVAAAVGCRVIALYGSTSPGFTPPLSSDAVISKSSISCSPCFKRTCPYGHKKCLEDMDPESVYALFTPS